MLRRFWLTSLLDFLGLVLVRVTCFQRTLRIGRKSVENSDEPLARALVLVSLQHHGCVAQSAEIAHDLGISPIAELGFVAMAFSTFASSTGQPARAGPVTTRVKTEARTMRVASIGWLPILLL